MKKIINNIEVKVAELVDKYQRIQLQKSDLQKNNDALNKMLQEQEEQIVALKDKVKLMNISKSIDVNKEGVNFDAALCFSFLGCMFLKKIYLMML